MRGALSTKLSLEQVYELPPILGTVDIQTAPRRDLSPRRLALDVLKTSIEIDIHPPALLSFYPLLLALGILKLYPGIYIQSPFPVPLEDFLKTFRNHVFESIFTLLGALPLSSSPWLS
jgi:hypothetical protein